MKLITKDELEALHSEFMAAGRRWNAAEESVKPIKDAWMSAYNAWDEARKRFAVQEDILREYRETAANTTPTPEVANV